MAGGVVEGIQSKNRNHARYRIQMERVNSAQMQLGRWDCVEASMFIFTIVDTVATATHLRSSALLRLLSSCFVFCIADFPRNRYIRILVHQRSPSTLQSSSGFPTKNIR